MSAYGTGGPGFHSCGRVVPNSLQMVVMASLLGTQEFRVSIRLIPRCRYRKTGHVLVSGVPHKPKGDPKPAVLSLHGVILPKLQHRERHAVKANAKNENLKIEEDYENTRTEPTSTHCANCS